MASDIPDSPALPRSPVFRGRWPLAALALVLALLAAFAIAWFELPALASAGMALAVLAGIAIGYVLARDNGGAANLSRHEQDLTRQREELRALARRIITLQEDERSALSRELHDDIGQDITAIKLSTMALADEDPARRGATIAEIGRIADDTVVKLRNISLLLRPPQLDALGLESALRWQSGVLLRSGGPRLDLQLAALPHRPDPAVEVACFRIAQEALTNALRHSGAENVVLTLACDGRLLHLEVEDDGRGFDHGRTHGLGMVTMRERAQQLGGLLEVDTRMGAGTCVRARLPMQAAATGSGVVDAR